MRSPVEAYNMQALIKEKINFTKNVTPKYVQNHSKSSLKQDYGHSLYQARRHRSQKMG